MANQLRSNFVLHRLQSELRPFRKAAHNQRMISGRTSLTLKRHIVIIPVYISAHEPNWYLHIAYLLYPYVSRKTVEFAGFDIWPEDCILGDIGVGPRSRISTRTALFILGESLYWCSWASSLFSFFFWIRQVWLRNSKGSTVRHVGSVMQGRGCVDNCAGAFDQFEIYDILVFHCSWYYANELIVCKFLLRAWALSA